MDTVPVSVVIICRNARHTIQQTIDSALALTDDVIVVDSGSNDGTLAIITGTGAKLISINWMGFGLTKNRGNREAKYQWVLSLDADEELSSKLIASIKDIDFTQKNRVYEMQRINYFEKQPIHYGEWKNDWVQRLFCKEDIKWNSDAVHERLLTPAQVKIKKLEGELHHYTASSKMEYACKLDTYALLMADKYFAGKKKVYWFTAYLSSIFNFIKNYVLLLGCLDGKAGWHIALAHAHYTFKKYRRLQFLYRQNAKR